MIYRAALNPWADGRYAWPKTSGRTDDWKTVKGRRRQLPNSFKLTHCPLTRDVDHDLRIWYARVMDTVGMRELRQNPATVFRAVEAGNEVRVSVSGRPVARIVPLEAPAWVDGERAARIYTATVDAQWEAELHAARQEETVDDPWA